MRLSCLFSHRAPEPAPVDEPEDENWPRPLPVPDDEPVPDHNPEAGQR